jgi:hypothetical protein
VSGKVEQVHWDEQETSMGRMEGGTSGLGRRGETRSQGKSMTTRTVVVVAIPRRLDEGLKRSRRSKCRRSSLHLCCARNVSKTKTEELLTRCH